MIEKSHSQFFRIILFILFLCLLLWNTGADVIPVSKLHDSEPSTPTGTQIVVDDTQSDIQDLESDTPIATPTSTLMAGEPTTTSTHTQTSESVETELNHIPMPAIFAAGDYASDELVVRFKASISETRIEECFRSIDVQVQSEIEELQALVLRIISGDVPSIFNHILNCSGVLYVEPNFLLQAADTIPNDTSWSLQYGLVNIRAPQGWDLETGSAAVTIAIVDSGVDYGHPDLAGKLVAGYDFVNGDANPQDDYGHGTHVAGIAAASSNNSAGIAGVSWGARIMPVKVLNAVGDGTFADTADGIIWAVDHGAQVINLSLGGSGSSSLLEDAVNYAHNQGSVIVAAAGTSGDNFVLYPARYPNVIAVASTNSSNNWAGSNYGPEIDISAPGNSIYSAIIGGYDYKSGSSMATGFVSGLAAILRGVPGNASPDTIESQIESTALDIEFAGWDEYTGAGLIQMDAAIQLALPSTGLPDDHGSPSVGGDPGFVPLAPSNTPIPTWTVSATPTVQEKTATFTTGPGTTGNVTEAVTSTLAETDREVEAQAKSGFGVYVLPCTGLFLIFLGIFLAWFFTRKRNR